MSGILEWLLNLAPGELAGTDWRIGFASDHSNYIKLALFGVLAGMVYLTVHCYRREGAEHPRRKVFLAGVRIAVMTLVLLVLFQPAIVVRVTETLYSSVVVLIDDSMSMSFTDRYRSDEQAAVRAGLMQQLDVTEAELETLSRSEILRRKLLAKTSALAALSETHPIEVMCFSTDKPGLQAYTRPLGRIPRGSGDKTQAIVAAMLDRLGQKGHATNHAAALRDAIEAMPGTRIGACVLFGDGQSTQRGSEGRLEAVRQLANQRGLPRYTVLLGDPTPPRNIAASSLRIPREIRALASTPAVVTLTHRNMGGESVVVRLYRKPVSEDWPADFASKPPLAEKTVTLEVDKDPANANTPNARVSNRGVQNVEISFQPRAGELGEYVYRTIVTQTGDEKTTADNLADAFVKITDDKIRILLISGDAGWEFQYIRNYFLRQPGLYRLSVWQQNADPNINRESSTGMELTRLPTTLRELISTGDTPLAPAAKDAKKTEGAKKKKDTVPPGYDVVILYDPAPGVEGFNEAFLKLLHDYVTIHRGGLCYIASNKHTYDLLSDPKAKPLVNLLPVVVARGQVDIAEIIQETRPKPYTIQLTSYGTDHPITRLESGAKGNREIWSLLPGVFWSQAIAKRKPAARVLAESSNPAYKTRSGGDEPIPLIAVQSAGSGRVMFAGFDESWRWRRVEEGFYHRRFWGNVVRYLSPTGARQVQIAAGGDRFQAGDKINVEVEAFDREYKPIVKPELKLQMIDMKTGEILTYALPAMQEAPGRYKGQIPANHTGTFQLTCDLPNVDPQKIANKQIVVEWPQAEAKRSEASAETLASIASQGDFALAAHEIDSLAKRIPTGTLQAIEEERYLLWDTNLMWLLIASLLTVEWFLRKRSNMA